MRLHNTTIDARDPRALADFYRELTGWAYVDGHEVPDPEGDRWLMLQVPDSTSRLAFQQSDAVVTPWPGGARVHVDLHVPDLSAAHEHALACGARPLTGTPEEEGHPEDPFRVYADPEGHPFCLCAPPLPES